MDGWMDGRIEGWKDGSGKRDGRGRDMSKNKVDGRMHTLALLPRPPTLCLPSVLQLFNSLVVLVKWVIKIKYIKSTNLPQTTRSRIANHIFE